LQHKERFDSLVARVASVAAVESACGDSGPDRITSTRQSREVDGFREPWKAVARIACFFAMIALLVCVTDAAITSGLRRVKTSFFGISNRIMEGKINAQIVITGSSRASVQYDPRRIQEATGRSAFNLGLNGSQTDMQVAVLKTYLEHNRRPDLVVQNLDAFSFVTTHEVFDFAQYIPYLYDKETYEPLRRIKPNVWKSRYLPLYGYVVEDMNFSWITGLKGFFGWSPREDCFLGFNPRWKEWTGEFERFKAANPAGVRFEIEPAGIRDLEDLVDTCQRRGIQLIFVYSPEYSEMQSLTSNRSEIFGLFHELARRRDVPLWDYSNWTDAGNRTLFYNSQHLNARGAEIFSADVANRLKEYLGVRSKSETTVPDSRGASHLERQQN
jgi:hypothetical protein